MGDYLSKYELRKKVKILGIVFFAVVLMFFVSGCLKNNGLTAGGDIEHADLAMDPNLVTGTLSNGLRYVLLENQEPADRVSMHLDVQAGSMQELESQRGLAHFLEHILFCGSTHFKPGELIEFFQRIGMQFGADANAHTGFYETVYDILLPDGGKENMAEGLLVLQDYAQGALILQSEVDRERNVILAEKRDRDSSSYRTFEKSLGFELPGSRVSKRLPIGLERVIEKADSKLLRDYYDTWYRPENMIIVVVGDFDAATLVPEIEKMFSSIEARSPKRDVAQGEAVLHHGVKSFYHNEPEAGATTVDIETIKTVAVVEDSVMERKNTLFRRMANAIVDNRLEFLTTMPESPFTTASIWSGVFLRNLEIAQVEAQCSPDNWEKSLALIEQEIRIALKYGFTDDEMARVRADYIAMLEKNVKTASTRNSQSLARQIIGELNNDRVFLSPQQEMALLGPVVQSVSKQMLHEAFKSSWSANHRLVMVTGNVDLGQDQDMARAKILSVYRDSEKKGVSRKAGIEKPKFPYLPEPDVHGKIKRQKYIEDRGIHVIDFENGVRLNLKKTDFKANEVLFSLAFGSGRSGEPADKPGLAALTAQVLNEGGFGHLNGVQIDQALAGKNTDVNFAVGEECFFFKGGGVSGEMPLIFQLLNTWIEDPGFSETALNLSMGRFKQAYKTWSHTVEGAMKLHADRFLAGGDSRFGMPPESLFETYGLEDIKKWVYGQIKESPIELSIVGDFDIDEAVKLASIYTGSLPKRDLSLTVLNKNKPGFPAGRSINLVVPTKISKAMVEIAWQTDDFWDIKRTRRFSVLAQVFSEKLRKRVREKLGAAYSPYAYNRPGRAYEGYGVFQAVVHISPEQIELVVDEVKGIASDLIENGVTDEQLRRALDPVLTGIKDMVKTNGYWLNSVLSGSERRPEKIKWSRSIQRDYASVTGEDLAVLAKSYLTNIKAATVIVKPKL